MTSKIRNKQVLAEEEGRIYPSVGEPGAWQPVHSHSGRAETPSRRGHSPRTWHRGGVSPPTFRLGASPRGTAQGGSQAISLQGWRTPPEKKPYVPSTGQEPPRRPWVRPSTVGGLLTHGGPVPDPRHPACGCPRSPAILRQGEARRGGEEAADDRRVRLRPGGVPCPPGVGGWSPARTPLAAPMGAEREGAVGRCRPTCGSSHAPIRDSLFIVNIKK